MIIEDRRIVLKAREAAQYLRISLCTLDKIEHQGSLVPFRTPGGHRRYTVDMLNDYLEGHRFPASKATYSIEGR